ncbi:MAG TPA: TetR/AcrR family transcriptional regulator [Solirubrobacteraceae bacterium]|jgi:AcrR family transcriptional regulator|nr:TetR/AcrR family transcriptional regulator [Solirubrobacteraceae bacterium]
MFHYRRYGAEPGLISDTPKVATAVATPPRTDPRRLIFEAMIETVALRGYDRTTVSRLLSSAGVQEAVFNEHFRDKHDCFLEAVDDLICRVERSALELFQRPAPWAERVSLALESLLCALACSPQSARVLLVEMLGAGPAACERHRAALSLFTSLIEEGRSQASSTGHLPPQTSEAIVGGIASIVHRRVLQGETAELPALHADLTYFALLPYLDHERALAAAECASPS